MRNTKIKLAASFIAVLATLVVSGCNSFENPDQAANTADTQDAGSTDASVDTQADSQGTDATVGTDAATQDLGNQDTAQPTPDAQVEVAQEVTSVDAGPKPECAQDADCNDNNPCTGDICVVGGACKHMAITAKCDDGNACTDNDTCSDGQCKGTTKTCDDSNPCTDDFCVGGACVHGVNTAPCDDGNVCTKIDSCKGGSCQSGEWLACDDNNPCTYDNCVDGQGCVNDADTCDDNNPCTTDSCDSKSGQCQNAQKVCDDGKSYTYDWCDSTGWYDGQPGQCVHENKWDACTKDSDCEDGNACTIDVCDGLEGTCKWVSKNCNDYDPCTIDSCIPAKGCAVMIISCDDNNSNTTDSCNKWGACVHTPITTTIPPVTTGNINVKVGCGAVACEVHLFFGQQANGTAFDLYLVAQANSFASFDVPKSQLSVWGLEVAARLTSATWPWFGCDAGAPSLSTVTVKVNDAVTAGALTKHPWTCGGNGEGNLAFAKSLFQ